MTHAAEFLLAIDREIAAVLADNGTDTAKISLSNGTRVTTEGALHTYEFTARARTADVQDRMLVRLSPFAGEWARATVVSVQGRKVQLQTGSDLGPAPPNAQLRKDDTLQLEVLKQRITTAGTKTGPVDTRTADWVLGEGHPAVGRCPDPDRLIPGYGALPLNARQRFAIEHALASETTFVWGPPGAGKTEVVSRIIEGCYRQGLRTLLLAPTNVAVDQALERVCDLLAHEEHFGIGLVRRAGEVELASLRTRYGPHISAEGINARLAEEFAQRESRWHDQIAAVEKTIARHDEAERTARRAADLRRAGDEPAALQTAERELAAAREELRGTEPRERLEELLVLMRKELTAIAEERLEVSEAMRDSCRVLGATVTKAVFSRQLLKDVDVVVLDEASMVALPFAWCVAGLARKRVVIAGDFRQLPAVTLSSSGRNMSDMDREHARRWMDRDSFYSAGLVDDSGAARPDHRMICLDTQYRMRQAICAVVNEVAYPDAPLHTARNDVSRLPTSPLLASSLILVDTSKHRIPAPSSRKRAHMSNAVHDSLVHELVRGLQYDRVLPTRKWPNSNPGDRMAVIAPYLDQVGKLRAGLADRFGHTYEGVVDTVHRFQGSQRPLVIVDTVAGAGRKVGTFFEDTGLSSATTRLLNVALSRAQDHLVVVADVDFLTRQVSPGSAVTRMLRHLERHAHQLSVDALVPVRSAADLAGLGADDLTRPAFFPADEVDRAVAWDIGRAAEKIDIYCAFLYPARVKHWLGFLVPRIAAGVQVTVCTRPSAGDASRHATAMELLRTSGCDVQTRDRMHEKVVIIDDRVLWHGSMNLLSDIGPTDLMMRIVDTRACGEVRSIISVARMERPAREWHRNTSKITDTVPGEIRGDRLYLAVHKDERHHLKQVVDTAAFDWQRMMWHVDAKTPREKIARWLP